MTAESIEVSSGVSHRTGQGFITIEFGSEKGQLDIEPAKQFGMQVIEAAMAAESDAAFFQLMSSGDNPLDPMSIAKFLVDLRAFRGGDKDAAGRAVAHFTDGEHRSRGQD